MGVGEPLPKEIGFYVKLKLHLKLESRLRIGGSADGARHAELKVGNKIFGRYIRLFQDTSQGAGVNFAVHQYDATAFSASQDGVTAALPEKHESQPL